MTKDFTLLALASLLAFTACSTDDDYTATVVQPERQGVSVSTNNPLTVYAGMDGTRSTVVAAGRDGLTGFRLFGNHRTNPNRPESQHGAFLGNYKYLEPILKVDTLVGGTTNGVVYSKDSEGKWTTSGIAAWPTDTVMSNDFYGIAIQGETPDTVADADRDPDTGEALRLTATTVDFSEMGSDDAKLTYTVPSIAGNQKDLLISSVRDSKQKDNYGAIILGFKHALANVTLQLRYDGTGTGKQSDSQTSISEGYKYGIDTITFHNIYTTGTYSFADSAWTTSGSPVDIKIVYGQSNPLILTAGSTTTYNDLVAGDSSIMIIPQTVNVADVSTSGFTTGTNSYIEIHGICWNPNKTVKIGTTNYKLNTRTPFNATGSYYTNLATILQQAGIIWDYSKNRCITGLYFAFPNDFKFEYNKKYNIRLNVYKGYYADGTSAL